MEWQDDESQRGSALWLIIAVSAMASLIFLTWAGASLSLKESCFSQTLIAFT